MHWTLRKEGKKKWSFEATQSSKILIQADAIEALSDPMSMLLITINKIQAAECNVTLNY